MIKYYTLIVTRKTQSLDDEVGVQSFQNYELFKHYALSNASDSEVIKQRLLKTELASVPMVTELKLFFSDNLVAFREVKQ